MLQRRAVLQLMKTIPQEWTRSGYKTRILERQGDVILAQLGQAECYEVLVVRRHNGLKVGGKAVEPSEYLPKDEDFGTLGWYFCDRDRALAKFAALVSQN